jgi:hypothetical protein
LSDDDLGESCACLMHDALYRGLRFDARGIWAHFPKAASARLGRILYALDEETPQSALLLCILPGSMVPQLLALLKIDGGVVSK